MCVKHNNYLHPLHVEKPDEYTQCYVKSSPGDSTGVCFYIFTTVIFWSFEAYKQSRRWSKCTQAKLEEDFKVGNLDHCLKNVPETLQRVGNTPVCGNFFVEEGWFYYRVNDFESLIQGASLAYEFFCNLKIHMYWERIFSKMVTGCSAIKKEKFCLVGMVGYVTIMWAVRLGIK